MSFSQDVSLVYSEMSFYIPDGYKVIVTSDIGGGMLAFKYGDEKGSNFIALSDKTNDLSIDYGCPPGEFYIELFSPSGSTKCHKRELDALSEGFLKDGVKKVWKTSNTVFNYLDTGDSVGSFVFICRDDGKTIKVSSDFLSEDDFRKMFGIK
ncbi:MAG: hypothetical protein KZQ80_16675 [Candidatus Thiodiazotropha sp. (ex Monitilora ramsayi)]|nr:hypothetical protein [Candidatus Thiodiazotropha sp. (ex Monitilora ramsayi)]